MFARHGGGGRGVSGLLPLVIGFYLFSKRHFDTQKLRREDRGAKVNIHTETSRIPRIPCYPPHK